MAGSPLRTSAQRSPLPAASSRDLACYRWSPAPARRSDPDRLVLLACFAGLILVSLLLALEGGAA